MSNLFIIPFFKGANGVILSRMYTLQNQYLSHKTNENLLSYFGSFLQESDVPLVIITIDDHTFVSS